MSDQPPDAKVVQPDADVEPVEEEVKPKLYYIPNRHDRRAAEAIKRREERKKRKSGQR
jgi:hypothetical protein